ncbi:hypothetical protein AvCA_30190 [Azotobacter vinelandii CA]|uniref:Uncharacterized protein n=2 Tax=Azotobacter vinelandii TaxID=354 RepID=C1DN17_AZOVD|nr:hypothetical protein Avin_30190 [Azotobacter vinelandii DJ]AGK16479.1 hypothetical protein AvCA_30190 [Azotobacter vinelandii CA]AGK21032.1 hypothetical protein AvCA6_30190 [Azotobacter vinelandii CA6]
MLEINPCGYRGFVPGNFEQAGGRASRDFPPHLN